MINLPALAPWLATFIFGIAVGGWVENSIADREINELKEEHFKLVEQINKEGNEAYALLLDKLKAREKELADALDARDRAVAVGNALRADAGRLRQRADKASAGLRALPRASDASCQRDRERLARCTELLGEGADLAGEGAGLALRIAGDKDAIGVK